MLTPTWSPHGKSEDNVLTALIKEPAGAVADTVRPGIESFKYVRDSGDSDWYYSRMLGFGVIQVMAVVGFELINTIQHYKWKV